MPTYDAMRVEGGEAHPMIQPTTHDWALAIALSVARYPIDSPLDGVRYLVYRDGLPCGCKTCAALSKEGLFDPNVCRQCAIKSVTN